MPVHTMVTFASVDRPLMSSDSFELVCTVCTTLGHLRASFGLLHAANGLQRSFKSYVCKGAGKFPGSRRQHGPFAGRKWQIEYNLRCLFAHPSVKAWRCLLMCRGQHGKCLYCRLHAAVAK